MNSGSHFRKLLLPFPSSLNTLIYVLTQLCKQPKVQKQRRLQHAGFSTVGDDGAVAQPDVGMRIREEEAADRHQEASGQLLREITQRRRAKHALHWQAGGRHRV